MLPAGWMRDESGALRRVTVHSMLRRLPGWDYRARAIYQITITLDDRASQALGRLEVKGPSGCWVSVAEARVLGLKPEEIEARVIASELGEAVKRCWEAIPNFYPQVKVIGLQLMPDHFHGLLFVTEPLGCHLGQVVKGFKTGCNKAARALDVLFSPTVSERTGQRTGPGLFAEGFQDTILFHEGQLDNMFRYLADNPRRRAIKALFPDLFRVVGEIALPLRLSSQATARGHFSAIGNRFLLERPLAQVQVSRSDFGYKREPKPGGGVKIVRDERGEPVVDFASPLYVEKKAALFAAAKHGAVLISPCVSDGERQIAREALADDLPLVALRNKGFSKLQKPSGRAFDACAAGRLLLLAPAAWPYQPGEKKMTRFDATAMNRLCQWIVGEDAAEINYHGMKPENIEALARAAAKVDEAKQ